MGSYVWRIKFSRDQSFREFLFPGEHGVRTAIVDQEAYSMVPQRTAFCIRRPRTTSSNHELFRDSKRFERRLLEPPLY